FLCLFFFQAEDGIRDFHVTGVQTCALPISIKLQIDSFQKLVYNVLSICIRLYPKLLGYNYLLATVTHNSISRLGYDQKMCFIVKSEERRVGKECRSWWCAYCYRKNRVEEYV